MNLLAQLLINGIANGAVYALMAVGFAIVFNATHVFHLAHGAVLTFAAYCFYLLWRSRRRRRHRRADHDLGFGRVRMPHRAQRLRTASRARRRVVQA